MSHEKHQRSLHRLSGEKYNKLSKVESFMDSEFKEVEKAREQKEEAK